MLLEITGQAGILSTPMPGFHLARVLALCLTAAFASPGQNQPVPPRDNAPVAAVGTGSIRGRVTDRETGKPLGRVLVTLMSTVWRDQAMSSATLMAQTGIADDASPKQNRPRTTVTAADGRFEFNEIPPGAYAVSFDASFTRGTHLDQSFGQAAPPDPLKPGRRASPIEVRDGHTQENVDVALWRAFAIEGRVVDDDGEPIAQADVNVSQWDSPSSMSMGRPRITDDRGMFRLFGLRPGQYRICADAELHFGLSQDGRDKLVRTCYPSAVSDGDAQPVVLSSGDIGPIEIRLQRNHTYQITGIAIDSSGAVASDAEVQLVAVTPTGRSSSSIEVKPDGHFLASSVRPGNYAIQVSIGNWHPGNREDKRDREMGYVPVRVDAADVDGVVVATSKAAKVAGRIVFEGGVPDHRTLKLMIMSTPDEQPGGGGMMFVPQSPATVRDDMSFELDDLFGPQLLMVVGAPHGWIVKSVKYRGDDVTDRGIEFRSSSDPRLLEVTLTNQTAIVTGRVLGDDGRESSDAFVVLLPADVSRWRPFPGLPVITPKADGTFAIGPVRAGEYIVAAVTGLSMPKLFDPSGRADIAERIAKAGERLILIENEKHAIDLRITKLP
jgi:protocatechuate 3,4-dioxygenase beta subunit